jgi:hypothetical protein
MRRLLIFVLLLIATAVFADDNAYKFRASWVDGHYELTNAVGAHWKWLKLGCPKNVECELKINSRGGATPDHSDLGFLRLDDHTLRVSCLRKTGCQVNTISLRYDQAIDIASSSVVDFSASPETPPSSSRNR